MSSYFDSASRMASAALKAGDEKLAGEIVQQVVITYGDYLAWIQKKRPNVDDPRWERLKKVWIEIISREAINANDRAMKLSVLIERVHDFAHSVGSAGLKTRDGRPVLDNPYIAARDSDIVIQEQKHGRGGA